MTMMMKMAEAMVSIENIVQQDCEKIPHDINEMTILFERTATMVMVVMVVAVELELDRILMKIKMDSELTVDCD